MGHPPRADKPALWRALLRQPRACALSREGGCVFGA